MKAIRFALGSFLFLAFFAGASLAQVQRTFVSGLGSDNNPCNRTAPCRTFGQAIMGTNAGGEVIVLDSAGYGAFTITKSVSIIAPQGVYAGISVFSGNGIEVNAGGSDTVVLRGLTVNNQGSAGSGILFDTGAILHIENCVVSGFGNGLGIWSEGRGNLLVKDTTARGNNIGISINGAGLASLEQVRLDANDFGLEVGAGTAAIRNSSISGNIVSGVFVSAFNGELALLDIDTCLITNNGGVGILTHDPNTFISISNCTVSHNRGGGFSVAPSSGILSRGNNGFFGNGADVGSLTQVASQ